MSSELEARIQTARDLFAQAGRTPFAFQEELWRAHALGKSGLLNAGTGSGKTLAAWLGPVLEGVGDASPGIRVLWITPLRALARDLEAALREPLAALGSTWRVEQRTGDTTSARRSRQRKDPPQALITTPESLSLLFSYADMLPALGNVTTLIVDEWHEFLGSKRGVQLELVIARLRGICSGLRVWGLSATVPDLPAALHTLLGPGQAGQLIRSREKKAYEIDSVLPATLARFPWAGHLGLVLLPRVLNIVEAARTTLIFTNTRSQAELWYQAIVTTRLEWLTSIAIHHGSIDAKVRRAVEDGLKAGSLRCVVCTSSLDLGVDFPPVDRVIQIGSPKGVARLLQRAGRSGHQPGQTSRVTVVPTHAWELVECAAARFAAARGQLEPREGLRLSLDVLAQHLVTLAVGGGFDANAMLAEVRSTQAFAGLSAQQWQWALDFVTRGGEALHGYTQFRRVIIRDGRYVIAAEDLARRHRRSIGTITSDASVAVKWLKGGVLGFVEESFLGRLKPHDVFVFAGRVLQLARVRDSVAYVRLATTRSRYVPRWQGTRLPLSDALGLAVLEVLEQREHGVNASPELAALEPLLQIQSQWSVIPTSDKFLIEQHTSRDGFHLFVFPFAGRMLNEGIATLLAGRAAREAPRTFSITTNEYGFELLCADALDADEAALRRWLRPEALAEELLASLNISELARRQFRDIARIAGLVDPGMPSRSKSAWQLQVSSGLMFDVLERHDPHSLLLEQSRREVLESQLAHGALLRVLRRVHSQDWYLRAPPRLTPLSFPLWADRLQTQALSSETWQARIDREVRRLEKFAA